jgi:hypothetical protein
MPTHVSTIRNNVLLSLSVFFFSADHGSLVYHEPHPLPDCWVASAQELDEDARHGELHVGYEQSEGDGARPPVGHLHQPVQQLHARVRPNAHLQTERLS